MFFGVLKVYCELLLVYMLVLSWVTFVIQLLYPTL